MEIRHKLVSELSPVEYRACYKANLGDEGYMRSTLVEERLGVGQGQIIMLWDGPDDTARSLIGWALLTPITLSGLLAATRYVKSKSKYTVQFWVKRQHRKKSYGKLLMEQVKLHYDLNPHVFPHDEASSEFFSSYNVQVLQFEKHWLKKGKPKVA